MSDEIVYRFTPHSEGAFVRGVPQRDLTRADVDRMTGQQRADAFAPHPVHGVPLYTEVKAKAAASAVKKDGDA